VADVVGREKPVEEILAQGSASHEILKLAAEEAADLIVVGRGAEALGGARRPTAAAVAREARCPVLFVHEDVSNAVSRSTTGATSTTAAAAASPHRL
jgi:nucleotide-binding universal stress UspA family protein